MGQQRPGSRKKSKTIFVNMSLNEEFINKMENLTNLHNDDMYFCQLKRTL